MDPSIVFDALEFLLGSYEVAKAAGVTRPEEHTPDAAALQARKGRQHSECQAGVRVHVQSPNLWHRTRRTPAPGQSTGGPPGFFRLEGGQRLHSPTRTGAREGADIPPPPPTPVLVWLTRGWRLGVTRHWSTLTIQPWALWGGLREKGLRKHPGKVRGSEPLPQASAAHRKIPPRTIPTQS